MSLYEQPTEIIIGILSYIYPLHFCDTTPNIQSLNKMKYNHEKNIYVNKLLKKQWYY